MRQGLVSLSHFRMTFEKKKKKKILPLYIID